jgi:hypothetical protein
MSAFTRPGQQQVALLPSVVRVLLTTFLEEMAARIARPASC